MPKVALIAPGRSKAWGICEPLNLGYLAGFLRREGIEVRVIDEIAGQDVEKEIDDFCPDIAGITATTPVAPDAYRAADLCRKRGILTVMGGVHATVMPEEAARHVDIVVKGEGERAIPEIIKRGIRSGVVTFDYIKDIDEIPSPARDLLRQEFYLYTKKRLGDIVAHLQFAPTDARIGNILSSRGCPYDCTFCHNNWKGYPVRFHCPERVVEEMKGLVDDYNVDAIFFIDDNFIAKKSRFRKICSLIREEGLDVPWCCNATSNNIDEEIAELLVESGCRQIMFGFESGSQRMLDLLGKRTKVEKNARAARVCKDAGLIVSASFMVGNPTETVKDIRMTQDFIRENRDYIDVLGVNITTPYPGTAIWKDLLDRGLIPDNLIWEDFCQDELPVRVCYEIEPEELKRLHLETASIKSMDLSRVLNKAMVDPIKATRIFLRSPVTSMKILLGSLKRGLHSES